MASKKDLLEEWLIRVKLSQKAHYESYKILILLHYLIGISLIIITSTLAFINSNNFDYFQNNKLAVNILLYVSSIFAGLQTFLNFSERMEKHKIAGGNYGSIRRDIEELLTNELVKDEKIEIIKLKIDNLATNSPNIIDIIWSKVDKNNRYNVKK